MKDVPRSETTGTSANRLRGSALLFLALSAVFLGALSHFLSPPPPQSAAAPVLPEYETPCPEGQLPDAGVCVPVPAPGEALRPEGGTSHASLQPLRADRPSDYAKYQLPLAEPTEPPGIEEDLSTSVGPAVRVKASPRTSIMSLTLEGQQGATEVVFASHGPPGLVMTAHRVERQRGILVYLLVHSDLQEVEERLLQAMPSAPIALEKDEPLGTAGPAGFLLALRQLRRDAQLTEAVPDLPADAVFATDPRNLLPLRP